MKRVLLILVLALTSTTFSAQTKSVSKYDSIASKCYDAICDIGYKIHSLDRYKLYPTQNIYTFLKLDTSTGRIDLLQWSLEENNEGTVPINEYNLSVGMTGPGTFELYPTQNIYQFILLNQVTGESWHVQWGTEANKLWIRKIY